MVKRTLFGILWAGVFYFLACVVIGAIAGGIAGSKDPANAALAGQQAGFNAVAPNRIYIGAGAIVLSAILSCAGILPGTKIKHSLT